MYRETNLPTPIPTNNATNVDDPHALRLAIRPDSQPEAAEPDTQAGYRPRPLPAVRRRPPSQGPGRDHPAREVVASLALLRDRRATGKVVITAPEPGME